MALDWPTFLLQIANFLVLIWLLKRFLYQPVLKVIEARQAAIDGAVAEARYKETAAETLAAQYESRLKVWEQEREKARAGLREEISAERERLLADLRRSLDEERTRARAVEEKAQREQAQRAEAAALDQAGTFLSRLLQRLAGPELEAKLVAVALEDLAALDGESRTALRTALRDGGGQVNVATAYALPENLRAALREALAPLLGREPELAYGADPALLAGVRITLGPWTLRANLADELKAFSNAGGTLA